MKKRTRRRGVKNAKVWVQNIPRRNVMREYALWLKKHKSKPHQSIRHSQYCVSNTLQNKKCKKRMAHTNKCWIHLAKEDNLRIKPSNIRDAGKGLFAWKNPFPDRKTLSKYTGRYLNEKKIVKKYGPGGAEYALCDKKGCCVDANYTTDAAARFANDPRGSRYKDNADLVGNALDGFRLKSNKPIRAGEEILTNYGSEYWKYK